MPRLCRFRSWLVDSLEFESVRSLDLELGLAAVASCGLRRCNARCTSYGATTVHELVLMESLVAAVVERVGEERVTRVRLEVGRLAAVVPDALRFCFDVCTRGTSLEGATLEIIEVRGRARCRSCGAEWALEAPLAECSCGGFDLELLAGQQLRIKDVEVA